MTKKLEDWQQRVVDEAEELAVKCAALYDFLESATYESFNLLEQAKLTTQAYFMSNYLLVLKERIAGFSG